MPFLFWWHNHPFEDFTPQNNTSFSSIAFKRVYDLNMLHEVTYQHHIQQVTRKLQLARNNNNSESLKQNNC